MLVENTTFDNNCVNRCLNVTKFGMLTDICEIDKSHDVGSMETILLGNYEFLCYQNVCIYNIARHSVNTISRVLNHISPEREGYQHSDKVCGSCIDIP